MLGLALLLLMTNEIDCTGAYKAATVSRDSQTLTIVCAQGTMAAPRTQSEQEGFSSPQISSDGRLVGWLALTANCCTSYPLPTSLVILEGGKVQTFDEAPPIWAWTFQSDNTAVAYRQEFPHGTRTAFFTIRRISDGKVLAGFACDPEDPKVAAISVPSWATTLDGGFYCKYAPEVTPTPSPSDEEDGP